MIRVEVTRLSALGLVSTLVLVGACNKPPTSEVATTVGSDTVGAAETVAPAVAEPSAANPSGAAAPSAADPAPAEAAEDEPAAPAAATAARGTATRPGSAAGATPSVPPKSAPPTTTAKPAAAPAPAATAKPAAAPAAPVAATPAFDGPACRATSFKFSSVADACKRGGVKQAKAMMKTLVNRAKANGQSVKCTSCHSDSKTYGLKDNANADFKALLALPPG